MKKWLFVLLLLASPAVAQQPNNETVPPQCTVAQLAAGTCAPAKLGTRVRISNNAVATADTNCAVGTGAFTVLCEHDGSNWVSIDTLYGAGGGGVATVANVGDCNGPDCFTSGVGEGTSLFSYSDFLFEIDANDNSATTNDAFEINDGDSAVIWSLAEGLTPATNSSTLNGYTGILYDEWASPLTTNGPNTPTASLQRQGAPFYTYRRQARTDAAIDQAGATSVFFDYDNVYHTGRTPTINQEGFWPYLGIPATACPYGAGTWPNCTNLRNSSGRKSSRIYKLDESQSNIDIATVYCSGVGDCIFNDAGMFLMGSAPTGSDEGFIGDRVSMIDWPFYYPTGEMGGFTGGEATDTLTITVPDETIAYLGKWSLIVFDDAGLAERDLINNGGANGGVLGFENTTNTWTIARTADITQAVTGGFGTMDAQTHDTGFCFSLDEADRTWGGSPQDYWLLIVHGPGDPNGCCTGGPGTAVGCGCGADEFETYVGNGVGAPVEYVPGTSWPEYDNAGLGNGKITRCEQVGWVDFNIDADDGKPSTSGTYTMNFSEGTFDGPPAGTEGNIAAGTDWEWSPFGFPAEGGAHSVIMETSRSSTGLSGYQITGFGSTPSDETSVLTSAYTAAFTPGTNPARPSSFYGYVLTSPARESALRYATWLYGDNMSEGASGAFPLYGGNFGYPSTVSTEVAVNDWNTDDADHVSLDRIQAGVSGNRMEMLANTQDKAFIFMTSEASSISIKGEDNSGLDAPATTIYDTSGAGTIQVGSADVTSISVVSDGGTTTIDGGITTPSITVSPSATPTITFDDSDSASESSDATIVAAATDTGAGTEDVDLTLSVQVNSTLTPRITIDADGSTTIPSLLAASPTFSGTASGNNTITSAMIATEVRSMYWGAASLSVDGTQCATPAEVTINSGPKLYTVICTDNDASTIYGSVVMPDSWDGGTVTFQQTYIQTAADTNVLNGDVMAQCRGNGEVPSSTWGTEVAIDDAAVVGSNSNDQTTSAAVTPAGTCAAGDVLYWRWQLDATGTTTAVATLHTIGFKMEYTSNVGD